MPSSLLVCVMSFVDGQGLQRYLYFNLVFMFKKGEKGAERMTFILNALTTTRTSGQLSNGSTVKLIA